MRLHRILRPARTHPWLFLGCLVAFAAVLAFPAKLPLLVRLILGWDVLVVVFLSVTWTAMLRPGHETMRSRAAHYDVSDSIVLLVCNLAVAASLVAITAIVSGISGMAAGEKGSRLALAICTVAGSWLFLHTVLALHYAHAYYWPRRIDGKPDTHHGGLGFPGGELPDYADFLYFAFVLGACCQTADVSITSKQIRRLATVHGTIAFAFNAVLLALTINVAASLL